MESTDYLYAKLIEDVRTTRTTMRGLAEHSARMGDSRAAQAYEDIADELDRMIADDNARAER